MKISTGDSGILQGSEPPWACQGSARMPPGTVLLDHVMHKGYPWATNHSAKTGKAIGCGSWQLNGFGKTKKSLGVS
ncbi:hypothetical protein TWF730_010060 [Orbilia blumenaviensis]|uniref:Uncharacterized protein n=1 Tax=Orbilia blumenaviensis TaxID=1796055 RepID=A0AAV9UX10_9PEZI